MLSNDDPPGRIERFLNRLPEGLFLRLVLLAVVGATGIMLASDFEQLKNARQAALPGSQRTEPLILTPPGRKDHLRPYLPRTMPRRRGARPVRLPGYEHPPPASALSRRMVFRLGSGGRASALGRIEPGTAGELERFLDRNKGKVRALSLHSPGGAVAEAIDMARLIRKRGLDTRIERNGYCASSCPLVFAGGKERQAARSAWIGVHQVYALPEAVGSLHEGMAEAQKVSAVCQTLLVEMGVDPRVWLHAMSTAKDQLYIFTPEQLLELKLATKLTGSDSTRRSARR